MRFRLKTIDNSLHLQINKSDLIKKLHIFKKSNGFPNEPTVARRFMHSPNTELKTTNDLFAGFANQMNYNKNKQDLGT